MSLPTDAKARKDIPLFRGLFRYFPDALCEIAELSRIGNEQHNAGEPLHWAKEKSTDEGDALLRHQLDVGTRDTDNVRHATKVAWRALAQLQREIEADATAFAPPVAETVAQRVARQHEMPAYQPTVVYPRQPDEVDLFVEGTVNAAGERLIVGASRTGKSYDEQVREAERLRREIG